MDAEIKTETCETIREARRTATPAQLAALEDAMRRARALDADADAAWAVVGMMEQETP